MESEPMSVKPGDWVRFYRNGLLVLGTVQYTRATEVWGSGGVEVLTDVGGVNITDILEVRRA